MPSLEIAISEGLAIAELEEYGLPPRPIEILDNHGYVFVEQVVYKTREELMYAIPSFGEVSAKQLITALQNFAAA